VSFDVSDVVSSAVELCRVVDRESGAIQVGAQPSVTTFGDPTQIRMILVNLIKNALDATDGHDNRRVIVRMSINDSVMVEVLDNGPGVSADMASTLFEPFSSSKQRGLGIGLSICKTIAEGHGGRLYYTSPSDQADGLGGATFTLELPLAKEERDV
ncbi:MAG: HAMP domain-containing sensor histidine kinase, partial [Pseudomonadota bacterium]